MSMGNPLNTNQSIPIWSYVERGESSHRAVEYTVSFHVPDGCTCLVIESVVRDDPYYGTWCKILTQHGSGWVNLAFLDPL